MTARFYLMIALAIVITIICMQNTQIISLKIFFGKVSYPAAYFLIFTTLCGLIFGLLASRSNRKLQKNIYQQNDDGNLYPPQAPDTLTKEDRDYIS